MARPIPAVAQIPAAVVKPLMVLPCLENDACAKKADAADNLCGNAGGIGAACAVEHLTSGAG